MTDLPTGTLTLLFSDIEGSTSLLRRMGNQYAAALSAQRAILRAAFGRWRGREMGTEGDSFFIVFESVRDAVNAALQAQRELSDHVWPCSAPLRVRMGMHTGEPTRHEDGYIGMDVHRAARVASSAHGGQVVLSEATYRIAVDRPSEELSFIDLGWHRLKDIPQLEHVYQLAAAGMRRQFPALKSLGAAGNLPTPATSIVGREGELRELSDLLVESEARLITLTGPGGSGKTRLAIAVAALLGTNFPDGVYFVSLESVDAADVMWTTIAGVLGVTGEGGAPTDVLDYITARTALLVLDNLEQLPAASGVVGELLARAPGICIIATSRRPLHVGGEYEHPVPPLTLPAAAGGDTEAASNSGSVQLFVKRAQMIRPHFALNADNIHDVVEVCRRLDGLPLAIVLAAARVKTLSPRALLTRLDGGLELAGIEVGRPARQQTLRATIGWSYELLSPDQQALFRQLGVFSGDFALEAVAALTGHVGDPLDEVVDLVDASLAIVYDGPDGEPRVRLLKTIAAYARQQLAAESELALVRRRHAEHYLTLAEALSPQLRSSQYLNARDRIEAELDNLRAALAWATCADTPDRRPSPDELLIGLRLCHALSWFWYACGHQSEGRRWLSAVVDLAAGRESAVLMTVLHGLGVLLLQQGEIEQSRDALAKCLEYWRRQGDASNVAKELSSLAIAHRSLGEPDTARGMLEESIAVSRSINEKGRLANALSNLAMLEIDAELPYRAVELLTEALELDRELGDAWGVGVDHINLAGAMVRAGHIAEAYELLKAHGPSAAALGDVELTIEIIELFAMVFAERGDAECAARLLGASAAIRQRAELPIPAPDAAMLEQSIRKVRPMPDANTWTANVKRGTAYGVDDALADALREPTT